MSQPRMYNIFKWAISVKATMLLWKLFQKGIYNEQISPVVKVT